MGEFGRTDKMNYYLDIAQTVAERGTCLRRNFGAIIVNNDEIISTGYNGAPRGRKNCVDLKFCMREKLNIPRGELTGEIMGGTTCCSMCKRLVINAGIKQVVVRESKNEYTVYDVNEWIENDDSLSGQFGY